MCTRNVVPLLIFACLVAVGPVLAQDDDDTCLGCHEDAAMFEDLEEPSRFVVDREAFQASTHGTIGLVCVDCHADLAGLEDIPHDIQVEPANCGNCHGDIQEQYDSSLHGHALNRGNPRAPSCSSCHGVHDILSSSDPRSPTHKVRLPQTCASCHGTAGLLTDHIVKLPQSFTDYAQSVHGQGTERGIAAAAGCSDCHGVHRIRGAADPDSKINIQNVSTTCGQCHPDIQIEYSKSIHGRALAAGVTDSPTCTDCHGEHLILSPRDPDARTHGSEIAADTCGTCHDDPVIIAKYNLRGGVIGSYSDSYHGWAARSGSEATATCVSCHTAHSVLPETDEASAVHPSNVVDTCKQCHTNADEKFAASYTHDSASIAANPINRVIREIYIIMILVVIGGMVLHNLVIMNFYMIERRKQDAQSGWVLRFDKMQVVQHFVLTVSFVALVITGFALRFPEAWWVRYLGHLGMTEEVRANLHRISAVVMVVLAVAHMIYIFLTRRGLREFRAMLPCWQDVKDLITNLRYHTWTGRHEAEFGRYDYSQKAEYWALIWGTILMIVTGLVLWFPEASVKMFPVWIVSASQTIHYYEAWLATLAILVWHFFFVVFHPEEYPMSWTWLTGKMSEESVKRHHARWYEEEVRARQEAKTDDDDDVPTIPRGESSA